jgi:hypothetical protein
MALPLFLYLLRIHRAVRVMNHLNSQNVQLLRQGTHVEKIASPMGNHMESENTNFTLTSGVACPSETAKPTLVMYVL